MHHALSGSSMEPWRLPTASKGASTVALSGYTQWWKILDIWGGPSKWKQYFSLRAQDIRRNYRQAISRKLSSSLPDNHSNNKHPQQQLQLQLQKPCNPIQVVDPAKDLVSLGSNIAIVILRVTAQHCPIPLALLVSAAKSDHVCWFAFVHLVLVGFAWSLLSCCCWFDEPCSQKIWQRSGWEGGRVRVCWHQKRMSSSNSDMQSPNMFHQLADQNSTKTYKNQILWWSHGVSELEPTISSSNNSMTHKIRKEEAEGWVGIKLRKAWVFWGSILQMWHYVWLFLYAWTVVSSLLSCREDELELSRANRRVDNPAAISRHWVLWVHWVNQPHQIQNKLLEDTNNLSCMRPLLGSMHPARNFGNLEGEALCQKSTPPPLITKTKLMDALHQKYQNLSTCWMALLLPFSIRHCDDLMGCQN